MNCNQIRFIYVFRTDFIGNFIKLFKYILLKFNYLNLNY